MYDIRKTTGTSHESRQLHHQSQLRNQIILFSDATSNYDRPCWTLTEKCVSIRAKVETCDPERSPSLLRWQIHYTETEMHSFWTWHEMFYECPQTLWESSVVTMLQTAREVGEYQKQWHLENIPLLLDARSVRSEEQFFVAVSVQTDKCHPIFKMNKIIKIIPSRFKISKPRQRCKGIRKSFYCINRDVAMSR